MLRLLYQGVRGPRTPRRRRSLPVKFAEIGNRQLAIGNQLVKLPLAPSSPAPSKAGPTVQLKKGGDFNERERFST